MKFKKRSKPIDLVVHTKCPEKWILIDLENLQVYRGMSKPNKYGMWKRLFTINAK